MKPLKLATALLCLPALAWAHETITDTLTIDHPMAFETPPGAAAAAGYMTITNTSDHDDRLIALRADFPQTGLHLSQEQDGAMTMKHLDHVDIPAGETVEFAPGGLHVMFMGLGGDPFEAGEKIPATLIFEHAGEIAITFSVEPRSH